MEKHCCKVCGRSFANGRSLGGHERSHALTNYEKKPMCRYKLRKNPKKTWRLEEKEKEKDKICTKCGDIFNCWTCFFKHKKCHSEMNRDDYVQEEEEMQSQSDSDVTDLSGDYENEQKMGAFCLLMISRGVWSVTADSSDKESGSGFPKFDLDMNGSKKVQSLLYESEFSHELKERKASPVRKSSRYECRICRRGFHSYQALGGHRASHKKIKDASFTKIRKAEELNIQNTGSMFECSICGKNFASGQALGGHKRSHFVAANASVCAEPHQSFPSEIQRNRKKSLDLNLPALDDELATIPMEALNSGSDALGTICSWPLFK